MEPQEEPEGTRKPGRATKCQEPGRVRSPEEPGARKGQEQPGMPKGTSEKIDAAAVIRHLVAVIVSL